MRRLLLFGLLGIWPSAASAATLAWERGAGADSCAGPQKVQLELQRRLAKPLASVRPKQRVRVGIERRGGAWVARLEMRDDQGQLEGQRTLSVIANDCKKLEQYAVIVLALVLDGDAEEPRAVTPAAGAALESEPPAPALVAPEVVPTPTASPPSPAPAPAAQQRPRVSGAGELCLFVQGPVYGPGSASAPAANTALRSDGQRLRSALAAELVQRALFTVVEVAPSFGDELSLRSWLRKASELPAPVVTLPTSSGLEPLAQADYVLVPLVETLTVQDGLDYSLGQDPRAIVVNARVTLLGFDHALRRELRPVTLSASLAFGGDARNTAAVHLALQTALESIASDAVQSLGDYPAFSDRPRASSALGARRACAPSQSSVRDARVTQPAQRAAWDVGFYLDAVKRLAYAQPAESELVRARATGLRTQEFGTTTELGVGVRVAPRTLDDAGWRPGFDVRAASVDREKAPLILELQGGVGYELPLRRTAGLALLPHVSGGVLFSSGPLGGEDRERGQLETFLGATVNLDLTMPFYRLIGDFSPFVTLGAQYVLPLLSETPKSAFLDSKLPRLHGIGVALGFLMSGPRAAAP